MKTTDEYKCPMCAALAKWELDYETGIVSGKCTSCTLKFRLQPTPEEIKQFRKELGALEIALMDGVLKRSKQRKETNWLSE